MRQYSHIIQQQNLEIQFHDFSGGIGIQNEIKDVFYEKLLPRMQDLFDEIAQEKYSVSIEKLEIDCGLISTKYWKEELVEETLRHLRQELVIHQKKEIKNAEIKGVDFELPDYMHTFLFFLQKGFLPWNSRISSIKELEKAVSENLKSTLKFPEKINDLLKKNASAIHRMLYSFSETFFLNLLEKLFENKKEKLEEIQLFLQKEKLTRDEKHIAYSLLFKMFSKGIDEAEEFYSALPTAIKNAEKENELKKVDTPEKKKETDCIFIENAGLVLLHPFLPQLFENLGLWIHKEWREPSSQHIAVQVLEYLVSGQEDFPEFKLPLNKILCGMDVSEVLQPVAELPFSIKTECEHLLEEAIRHWSILKNTSVEGLRETFLQRNGKISSVDKGWLINVEQKGVDVLLSHLPWGIGVIKLPWTADMIFVEWI